MSENVPTKISSSQFFKSGETIFSMLCKKGPIQVHLQFIATSQREAESIGRSYCEKWGLRFIWVDTFLNDLSARPKILDTIYGHETAVAIEKEKQEEMSKT